MKLKHFEPREVGGLRPELALRLDIARDIAGVPFRITSGFRSRARNKAVGGKSNSAHLRGWAVDLFVPTRSSRKRYHLVRGLFLAGFRRVVLYRDKSCVHADADPSLPQDVLVLR